MFEMFTRCPETSRKNRYNFVYTKILSALPKKSLLRGVTLYCFSIKHSIALHGVVTQGVPLDRIRGSARGSFSDKIWVIFGSFWNKFWIVLGRFGIVLGSFWDRFGIIFGSFSDRFRIIFRSFSDNFCKVGGYAKWLRGIFWVGIFFI